MQCRIDECGADALVPVCGVDGGVVNVSASAVMSCEYGAGDGSVVFADEAGVGVAFEVSGDAFA